MRKGMLPIRCLSGVCWSVVTKLSFACYATVPKTSFDDPVHDVLVNLPASVSLYVASHAKLRRFLLVSSGGTVYGNAHVPMDKSPCGRIRSRLKYRLALEKYAFNVPSPRELARRNCAPGKSI